MYLEFSNSADSYYSSTLQIALCYPCAYFCIYKQLNLHILTWVFMKCQISK